MKKAVFLISLLLPIWANAQDFGVGYISFKQGNYTTALREFQPLADQGHVEAQTYLGWMYQNGKGGLPIDYDEAIKWYQLAADQGHADAQGLLGLTYQLSKGVPKDYNKAIEWYRLAADQGHADAQIYLGRMYQKGKGVPVDNNEAIKWYRLAADQGRDDAQTLLGWMYQNGTGVPVDNNEAIKWYRLAAEQGNADAQAGLDRLNEPTQDPQWQNYRGISNRFETQVAPASQPVARGNKPTLTTYSLRLAGTLPSVMLLYALTFLVLRKFAGLEYYPSSFLIGFVVSWNLATLPVLLYGQTLAESPGMILVSLVSSVAVVFSILLLQKDAPDTKKDFWAKRAAKKARETKPAKTAQKKQKIGARKEAVNTLEKAMTADVEPIDNKNLSAHEQAWDEIESGSFIKGLYARCYAEANGDDGKARAAYIKLRVQMILEDDASGKNQNKESDQEWRGM